MIDLGIYAREVLSAYGAALVLIVGLVAVSRHRARKVKAALLEVEERLGAK